MNKLILIGLLGIGLLLSGCIEAYSQSVDQEEPLCTDGLVESNQTMEQQLVGADSQEQGEGINSEGVIEEACTPDLEKKEGIGEIIIPPCIYYQKVGTYNGNALDIVKETAFNILKTRDSRISVDYLEVDSMPYVSFRTDPPTRATGDILYPIFHRSGLEENILVSASEVIVVKVSSEFYNTYGNELFCTTWQDEGKDGKCVDNLHFANNKVFIVFRNPC